MKAWAVDGGNGAFYIDTTMTREQAKRLQTQLQGTRVLRVEVSIPVIPAKKARAK